MRDFISSPPSFSFGQTSINDITLYNKEINEDTYKNICGNCRLDDTENGFHCHLMDLSKVIAKETDLMLIAESWDDQPNSSLPAMEPVRGHIDHASKNGVQRLLSSSLGFLVKKHTKPEEWSVNIKSGLNLVFNTAVKCPSVKGLQSIGVKSLNLCSTYVIEEIKYLKPKNIILFGPLSLKAILKKGWAPRHVGKVFNADFDGHKCKVGYLPSVESLARFSRADADYAISVLSTLFLKEKDYIQVLEDDYDCKVDLVYGNPKTVGAPCGALKRMLSSDVVAIDVETTGLNFLTERILSISLASKTEHGDEVVSIDSENLINDLEIFNVVKSILGDSSITKVFHNAKFDMKFLNKTGLTVVPPVQDTQVLAHLVNENEPKSLNFLTKKYFRGLI